MNSLVLENKFVRYVVIPGLFTIITLIGFTIFVYNSMGEQAKPNMYENAATIPGSDVALVLNTYHPIDETNQSVNDKLVSAFDLYRLGKIKKILLSGESNGALIESGRSQLIKMGVLADDIIEDKADNKTFDAVLRAKKVYGLESLTIISDQSELERALFVCQAQGMLANGYLPIYSMESSTGAGEYFARLKTYMDCNVLGAKPKYLGKKEIIRF